LRQPSLFAPPHCLCPFREQLAGKVKLADFGFACSFATEQTDDGKFKVVPVDMISREQISMEVCVAS
jgi:hypothetical protein